MDGDAVASAVCRFSKAIGAFNPVNQGSQVLGGFNIPFSSSGTFTDGQRYGTSVRLLGVRLGLLFAMNTLTQLHGTVRAVIVWDTDTTGGLSPVAVQYTDVFVANRWAALPIDTSRVHVVHDSTIEFTPEVIQPLLGAPVATGPSAHTFEIFWKEDRILQFPSNAANTFPLQTLVLLTQVTPASAAITISGELVCFYENIDAYPNIVI